MAKKAGKIIKIVITVLVNLFLVVVGMDLIATRFYIPVYRETYYTNSLLGSRDLTLDQDVTIVTKDNSHSATLEKGTVINTYNVSEKGVLYEEINGGANYYEYIPLEYFAEEDELRTELDETIENIKRMKKEKLRPANIKSICCFIFYLAIVVPVTVVCFRKEMFLRSVLIHIIVLLGMLVLLFLILM